MLFIKYILSVYVIVNNNTFSNAVITFKYAILCLHCDIAL